MIRVPAPKGLQPSQRNSRQHPIFSVTQLRTHFGALPSLPYQPQAIDSELVPSLLKGLKLSIPHSCPAALPTTTSPLHRPWTHPTAPPAQNRARLPGPPKVDRCLGTTSSVPAHGGRSASLGWKHGCMGAVPWLDAASHPPRSGLLCRPTHSPLADRSCSHGPARSGALPGPGQALLLLKHKPRFQVRVRPQLLHEMLLQNQGDLPACLNPQNILLSNPWTCHFLNPFLNPQVHIGPVKTRSCLRHQNLAQTPMS